MQVFRWSWGILPGIFIGPALWAQQPVIATGGVVNTASQAPQFLPNGSIAPGSIFTVYLSNVLPVPTGNITAYPVTSSFNDVSMTLTIGGGSVSVLMFGTATYPGGTVLDGILPSTTPEGTGTITATYKGATSAPAPVTVVANSFAWFTNNEGGSGPGAFTNSNSGARIGPANAANPGQFISGWGTGLGAAAPGNDTNGGSVAIDPAGLELWIGGIQVTPSFTGRSTSAGEDQINFQVPPGITGCAVPVVLEIGNIVSNAATISIAASGNFCNDPLNFSAADLQTLSSNGSLKYGTIFLDRSTAGFSLGMGLPPAMNTADSGVASFFKLNAGNGGTSLGPFQYPSAGTCSVFTFLGSSAGIHDFTPLTPLDAGAALTVTGPAGTQPMPETAKGQYFGALSGAGAYLNAGSYTMNNGSGGADVGAFTAGPLVISSSPVVWTNQNNIVSVARSQGVTVNWSGGGLNGFVAISGFSIQANPQSGAVFTCTAPPNAGQFTVPPSVLLALPPSASIAGVSTGVLTVGGITAPVKFTAPGIDTGYAVATASNTVDVAYQ